MPEDLPIPEEHEELWGTPEGWHSIFNVPPHTIKQRVESSEGQMRIDGEGRKRIYYAESYIRERLEDVLDLPHVNQEGCFEWKSEIYGRKAYWAKKFEGKGKIEKGAISLLLKKYGHGITGMTHGGTVQDDAYFPKSQVLQILEQLPQAHAERHLIDNAQDYWRVSFIPETYTKRYEFGYDEIMIARAPSGIIRFYFLGTAIERILGYDPQQHEEWENEIEKKLQKRKRQEPIQPRMDAKRCKQQYLLRRYSIRGEEVEEIESIIKNIKEMYPDSSNFLNMEKVNIQSLGFKQWHQLARAFGFTVDRNENLKKDFVLRLCVADRIYGATDGNVVIQKAQLTELLKMPHEELGDIALEWKQCILDAFSQSDIWFETAHTHFQWSALGKTISNYARRIGFSAHRLKRPEVRIIVGLNLYGDNDPFLLERMNDYEIFSEDEDDESFYPDEDEEVESSAATVYSNSIQETELMTRDQLMKSTYEIPTKKELTPENIAAWRNLIQEVHPNADDFIAVFDGRKSTEEIEQQSQNVNGRDFVEALDYMARVAGMPDGFTPFLKMPAMIRYAAAIYGEDDPLISDKLAELARSEEEGRLWGDDKEQWKKALKKQIPTLEEWVKYIDSKNFDKTFFLGGEDIEQFADRFSINFHRRIRNESDLKVNLSDQLLPRILSRLTAIPYYSPLRGTYIHQVLTCENSSMIQLGAILYEIDVDTVCKYFEKEMYRREQVEFLENKQKEAQEEKEMLLLVIRSELTRSEWEKMNYRHRNTIRIMKHNLDKVAEILGISISPIASIRHHLMLADIIWPIEK